MKHATIFLFLVLFFLSNNIVNAQSPAIWPQSNESLCNSEVELCFTVEDFLNVQAFQFSVEWDGTKIEAPVVTNKDVSLNVNFIPNLSEGQGLFTWTNQPLSPSTIADGETLFCIKFDVLDPLAAVPVRFTDEPPNIVTTGVFPVINEGPLKTVDGSVSCVTAAVDLALFEAKEQASSIKLAWQTASEVNHAYFEVEKGTDGLDFSAIAQVEGKGRTSEGAAYTYYDETPRPGKNFYRLRMVSEDGTARFSNILVSRKGFSEGKLTMFPNPVGEELTVSFSPKKGTSTDIFIYDIQGRMVFQALGNQFTANDDVRSFHLGFLGSGYYLVKLIDLGTGDLYQQKFIKK